MMMQPQMYHPKTKKFPRTSFKAMAGTTIAIGLLCFIIGAAQIGKAMSNVRKCQSIEIRMAEEQMEGLNDVFNGLEDYQNGEEERRDESMGESMGTINWAQSVNGNLGQCESAPAVTSMIAFIYMCNAVMFVITGSLGVGAARTEVAHRQSGLKTGFIVLNILNVLAFAPTVFIAGVAMCFITYLPVPDAMYVDYNTGHMTAGVLIAVMGLVQTFMSLIAASVSCCCAPVVEEMKVITMATPIQQYQPGYNGSVQQLLVDEKAQLVDNEVTA